MKAVILAAGKGTRMGELTKTTPKGLLKKRGKSLLEYTLEVLPVGCEEIIIVVEYLGDQIRTAFGNSWKGVPIIYVEQGEKKGTGGGVLQLGQHLKGHTFVVLPCDDIYDAGDILHLSASAPSMMVSKVHDRIVSAGNVKVENGKLVSITEGTHNPPCLVATGAYFLNDRIFDFEPVRILGRTEYGLPQTVVVYAKNNPVRIVEATSWTQVTTPEDLA